VYLIVVAIKRPNKSLPETRFPISVSFPQLQSTYAESILHFLYITQLFNKRRAHTHTRALRDKIQQEVNASDSLFDLASAGDCGRAAAQPGDGQLVALAVNRGGYDGVQGHFGVTHRDEGLVAKAQLVPVDLVNLVFVIEFG